MSPTDPGLTPNFLDRVRGSPRLRTVLAAAVPVGFVTLLLFIPYVLLLVHSFWRLQGGSIVHELTLENYRRLWGTPLYPNTILIDRDCKEFHERQGLVEIIAAAGLPMFREIPYERV